MANYHLPVLQTSPLRPDGGREFVHPADVSGRYATIRRWLFTLFIGIYVALPWIPVGGHPAVFFDIEARRFYLFGATFNAQDVWLTFFLLTGLAFALLVVTTLWGRIWCGYACPQTVFLEGVFRRVERWIEGPRVMRQRLDAAPWNMNKLWRKGLKHLVYVLAALVIAHVFSSYFVSLPRLFDMMKRGPMAHPASFLWVTGISAALYLNFAFFREQLCLVVCPYGRLQSMMIDEDTMVVGYDTGRGEPRGKASDPEAADCVACGRCVAVCPTGIDIRNGLQIDCIGCSACIDACDEVMGRLDRPPGLIRYDSLNGLAGKPRRVWRPRLALYAFLGVVGLAVALVAAHGRTDIELNIMRLPGPPFTLVEGQVRNAYELHVVNKRPEAVTLTLAAPSEDRRAYVVGQPRLELASLEDARVPVFVTARHADIHPPVRVQLHDATSGSLLAEAIAPFLGPVHAP